MTTSKDITRYLMKHLDIEPNEEEFVSHISQTIFEFVRKEVVKECVSEVYKKADELIKFEHDSGFTSLTASFGLHYWQCEKIADHLISIAHFTESEYSQYIEQRLDQGSINHEQRRRNIIDNINKKD